MRSTIAYATGFAFALALPALAAPASVSYEGLDATKPADVAAFSAKLDAAVKAACRGKAGVQLVGNKRMTCKDMAKAQAVSSLPETWRLALGAEPAGAKSAGVQVAERW
jgi:UrcA family protein